MGKDDLDGNDFGDIAVAERSPETVQSECESKGGMVAGKARESMAGAADGAASPGIQVWPAQPAAAEASKEEPAAAEANKVPEAICAAPVLSIGPPVTVGMKRKAGDAAQDHLSPSSFDPSANPKGQEWTLEEDLEVMQELKNIRHGVLSHKNMTVREAEKIQHVLKHRTVNAIKFRWNDKLKKRQTQLASSSAEAAACLEGWQETAVDPDAFFRRQTDDAYFTAPAHSAVEPHSSPPSSSSGAASHASHSTAALDALLPPACGSKQMEEARGSDAASAQAPAGSTAADPASSAAPQHLAEHASMLNDMDKVDKEKQAQAHRDVASEHQAAQQSCALGDVGEARDSKVADANSSSDHIKDALDMLIATPTSPTEQDGKSSEGGGVLRSCFTTGTASSHVCDGSSAMADLDVTHAASAGGSRTSPALHAVDGQARMDHEINLDEQKVDVAWVKSEDNSTSKEGDNCAGGRPSLDAMTQRPDVTVTQGLAHRLP